MWIIYSLLTAVSLATSDALTKRALASRDEYFIAWARILFALPLLLASLCFVEIPYLDRTFWLATLCALPLEIVAIILYTRALKVSPITLTMPFLALTPMFLIITSYLILGEQVSVYGGGGIAIMAIGGYMLNFHKMKHSLIEPIKSIFREKGSVLIIIVAFIFSITASLGKLAIEHSSPVFFGSFYFVLVFIAFTPIAFLKSRQPMKIMKKEVKALASIGSTYGMMIFFHMIAVSMSNVAYMVSIKRTSLLFSVVFGHFMFKEEKITEKAIGAVIMFIGFVWIVLSR
jgi:drug/metabolite transporter (DMT)-like permease